MESIFRRTVAAVLAALLFAAASRPGRSQTRSMCITQLSLANQACSLLPVFREQREGLNSDTQLGLFREHTRHRRHRKRHGKGDDGGDDSDDDSDGDDNEEGDDNNSNNKKRKRHTHKRGHGHRHGRRRHHEDDDDEGDGRRRHHGDDDDEGDEDDDDDQGGRHHHHHHDDDDDEGDGGDEDDDGDAHHAPEQDHPLRNRNRVSDECCRWLVELDSACVCQVLIRLPKFLSRPRHNYTVIVDDACEVSYECNGV